MTFTVYELVNDRLREIFVGLTEAPLHVELTRHRMLPDPMLLRWGLDELRQVRVVEIFRDRGSAEDFFRRYSRRPVEAGWRVLPAATP